MSPPSVRKGLKLTAFPVFRSGLPYISPRRRFLSPEPEFRSQFVHNCVVCLGTQRAKTGGRNDIIRRNLVLIGSEGSRRTEYFEKAALRLGIPLEVLAYPGAGQYPAVTQDLLEGCGVKIDPPALGETLVSGINRFAVGWLSFLGELDSLRDVTFLNSPSAIRMTLDKKACKETLEQAGLPVTPLLDWEVKDAAGLLGKMDRERVPQVFLKPRYGAGAAGVAACRLRRSTGEIVLYTSALLTKDGLVNTKKLRKVLDREQAERVLDAVLALDSVIERWIPKASHRGKTYDLRAVYQFGKVVWLTARQSAGPVTNLHLNDGALDVGELHLPQRVLEETEEICRRAAPLFPGLQCAGFDILLESGSLQPRIIEINAQGDLIYRDVFAGNGIYLEQARRLAQY